MQDILSDSILHHNSSFLWKGLSTVWLLLRDNLIWSVGDGKSIWVWHDSWIPHIAPLFKVITSTWSLEPDCYLEDMVTPDGAWNLDLFRIWVIEDIILLLVSIPLPHLDAGSDRISWLPSSKGDFSIKSAYCSL